MEIDEFEQAEQQNSITSFVLNGEYFCFDTNRIRHILEKEKPTNVPLSKDYIMGVINNHGNMVPVVDMGKMLGIGGDEESKEASIIVVQADDAADSLIGFLVDEVDEVFYYRAEQMKNEVVMQIKTEFQQVLTGTVNIGDKFIYQVNLPVLGSLIEK